MRVLRKILLATDLTPAAADAAREAAVVAKAFESEIVPLYVLPPVPEQLSGVAEFRQEMTGRLEKLRQDFQAEGIAVAEPVVAAGDAADEIVRQADALDVNMILLASGEKPADAVYRLGITAERVSRQSTRPVWIVRPDSDPNLRRILCPVDFSGPSRRALWTASHLSRAFQAELTVLNVVPPLASFLGGLIPVSEEEQQAHLARQQAEFDEFVKEIDLHDVRYVRRVRQGDAATEILAAAREANADLLVMGSVGKSGLARLVWGSVTEKVAREMPCSIITVKAEHLIRVELEAEIADLQTHIKQGQALLEKGFSEEALEQFELCLARDIMYAPAWQGAAAAHRRLGNDERAEHCQRQADMIIQSLWDRLVEADIRSQRGIPGRR